MAIIIIIIRTNLNLVRTMFEDFKLAMNTELTMPHKTTRNAKLMVLWL